MISILLGIPQKLLETRLLFCFRFGDDTILCFPGCLSFETDGRYCTIAHLLHTVIRFHHAYPLSHTKHEDFIIIIQEVVL